MQQALRRATAFVAALASLGCTGDSPVAPETARPKASVPETSAATAATPGVTPTDTRVPVLVRAAPPPADAPAAPLLRSSTGTNRYSREQSLGFQNGTLAEPCLGEGESMGAWQLRFSGYGCVGLKAGENGTALSMQPMTATSTDETHAPLLLGPEYGDRLMMTARVETVQQLRRNGEPNAWEVAWLLWQYQDDDHFYYFIPKPNGWEVGKRDPAYPGGQRFLATGTDLKFPVGRAYNVQITHKGNVFWIVVDGVALTSFTDTERPYVSGRIALYSEDAEIKVHQVSVRTGAF
ncbi:MAG: hypothetical protein H7Z40_11740 [Phycisphaerae bacterium]|nr:hypothetical protein [Gemmatimonadaceae bacterium]